MARHGRDLGELLEHLDLHDAVLVGASMGGNTLWAYVDQFGPSRLAGVVVVDQTPKMLNDATWPHGFYGYDASNAATFFDQGVPQLDGGRTVDRSGAAVARLAERLGGFPPFARAPRRRPSACCATTRCRTGATSYAASRGRCSCWRGARARSGRASTPRRRSPVGGRPSR